MRHHVGSVSPKRTNTPVAETVCAKFNRLTAVKPDILVGLKRSRINFRQGDETIDARIRIETYALARDVLFNLNLRESGIAIAAHADGVTRQSTTTRGSHILSASSRVFNAHPPTLRDRCTSACTTR